MEITQLQNLPFKEIVGYIDENFYYTPSGFKNGDVINAANENQGSAKVLFFAKMLKLSVEDTLKLFAEHYVEVRWLFTSKYSQLYEKWLGRS